MVHTVIALRDNRPSGVTLSEGLVNDSVLMRPPARLSISFKFLFLFLFLVQQALVHMTTLEKLVLPIATGGRDGGFSVLRSFR